ncbi:amino acid deaminase/aldolase [Flavobacteriaceae bacterium Ap0902]|nr:amino acid deaminase/aldolase [Flavobacteriaceae bacterium Ap0902]
MEYHFSTYYSEFYKLPKPFAFVDLDAFDYNLKQLLQRTGNKPVRLATKSVRSVAMLERARDLGKIERWMCFTLSEALYLESLGFDDLMVAYPSVQETGMERLADALNRGKKIYLTVDTSYHLQKLQSYAEKYDMTMLLSMDVDVSMDFMGVHFGVYRSSIHSVEDVKHFLTELKKYPGLALKGVMTYDAQIAGVADSRKGNVLNPILRFLKRKSLPEIEKQRRKVLDLIKSEWFTLDYFNAGGTGSIEIVSQDEVVTEVTFGSGLYQPWYFDGFHNFNHQPAAGFVLELCRNPQSNYYTALGGGYIASGKIGIDKQPLLVYPKGKLVKEEGCGEVQTPIQVKELVDLNQTNFAVFRHAKAGELCERFKELKLFSGGKLVDTVTTYRGDGQCFL